MTNMRNIQVYTLWRDHSWNTHWVKIPANTDSADIAECAVAAGHERFADRRDRSDRPVFVGLSFIPGSNDHAEFS